MQIDPQKKFFSDDDFTFDIDLILKSGYTDRIHHFAVSVLQPKKLGL